MTDDQRKDFAQEAERRREEGLKLFGQTFPIKDRIKEKDGIWDNRLRCWLAPSQAVAEELGGVRKEGKHGVYYMIGKSKFEREGGNPQSPPQKAGPTATPGMDCPACGSEPLDKNLYCWECGYRGT